MSVCVYMYVCGYVCDGCVKEYVCAPSECVCKSVCVSVCEWKSVGISVCVSDCNKSQSRKYKEKYSVFRCI